MANVIRIKRRAANGEVGPPATLKNAELAFNEADQKLYYGKGADGSGDATSIIAIGGVGWDASPDLSGYGTLSGTNTWTGNNTFTGTVNLDSTFQIDEVSVTTSAAELNLLDGSAAGTVVNSKAVVYGAAGEVNATTLQIAGTSITATAAELNLVDGSAAGTIVNSAAVVYGAAGEVNATTLQIAGTSITSTAAELNLLDGSVANTVVNSKAVVYGSAGEVAAASVSTTGNVTVGGNLTVNGTTVTVNAETLEVEDKNIELGKVETPTNATANGGGITLLAGVDGNKEFKWASADSAWTSSEHVKLAAGKDLIMAGATSGAVTVVVPDVAGSHTVTLPAATGTVVLDNTVCTAIANCGLDGGTF